jgi:hypothetical protein
MSDWHGYPQHPDAHPDLPWWRRTTRDCGWRRSDGVECDELTEAEAESSDTTEFLAGIDESDPLPPPPPMCGQVWVLMYTLKDGDLRHDDMVVSVAYIGDEVRVQFRGSSGYADRWPPLGAVLVAGPGAPWAPMGGDNA